MRTDARRPGQGGRGTIAPWQRTGGSSATFAGTISSRSYEPANAKTQRWRVAEPRMQTGRATRRPLK